MRVEQSTEKLVRTGKRGKQKRKNFDFQKLDAFLDVYVSFFVLCGGGVGVGLESMMSL